MQKLEKKDPPMRIILKMFFSPILLVFLPIVIGIVGLEKVILHGNAPQSFLEFLRRR